jgi:hypothetical protein
MQSESLLSGFAETPPIMERSSKIAQVECNQDRFLSFDDAKVRRCFQPNMMFFRMFRILFSPLRLLFSFPFSSACFPPC